MGDVCWKSYLDFLEGVSSFVFIYLVIYLFIYVSLFPRLRDDCQILKDAESNKTKTYK